MQAVSNVVFECTALEPTRLLASAAKQPHSAAHTRPIYVRHVTLPNLFVPPLGYTIRWGTSTLVIHGKLPFPRE